MNTTTGRAAWMPLFLGLLRIVVGLLFLQHGLAKLFGWPHVASFDNLHAFQLVWFAGIIELVGSILLVLGLFTRAAAFIMSGEMASAYFIAHFPRSFLPILNGGEGAILFCFIFFYFFLVGCGAYGVDNTRAQPLPSAAATPKSPA